MYVVKYIKAPYTDVFHRYTRPPPSFHPSKPRIDLRQHARAPISGPIATILIRGAGHGQVADRGLVLEHIEVEPGGKVPGDVAVERPDARVGGVPLDNL